MKRRTSTLVSGIVSVYFAFLPHIASALPLGYVEENGYINDGKIEWSFDIGMYGDTIGEIFVEAQAEGWRLAQSSDVIGIYNDFGLYNDSPYTAEGQGATLTDSTHRDIINEFFWDVGITHADIFDEEATWFHLGDDGSLVQSSVYRLIPFYDDFMGFSSDADDTFVSIARHSPYNSFDTQMYNSAIALVRDVEVSPVPVPAALPLFASGLALFGFIARRKKA